VFGFLQVGKGILLSDRHPSAVTPGNYPPVHLSWIVWGLGAAFYFTGFYQRVAPAVMTDQLMADFEISAAALGHLSAFYFYSYVAMQIPTGILSDLWGPRRLLTTGALVASLGTFLFALAPTVLLAYMGRLMIGGSVAVAFVAMLKLASHWFPPNRFATITGIALFCGVAGAVSAGVPLRFLVDHFYWRPVMLASGVGTGLITLGIWLFVRDDPSERDYKSYAAGAEGHGNPGGTNPLAGLEKVLRYRNTWLISLAPSGVVGPVLAFSGLWGVPYLSARFHLTPTQSAAVTSALMVAWAVAGPVIGAFSDRIGRRKSLYLAGSIVASAGWIVALLVQGLPAWAFVILIILIGLASGVMIIGFAFVKESVPPSLAGTVSGVCNMGVMLGPMILQPLMGWVLDKNWHGLMEKGARVYGVDAYQASFVPVITWSVLAVLLISITKETYCRQRVFDDE
jgi:MFS family permease